MTASNDTIHKVLEIVLKHIDKTTARKLMKELMTVPGNASFRETIMKMNDKIQDV